MAVPVAMYGPDPKIAESIGEHLAPEYEVVTVCLDAAQAEAQLPDQAGSTIKAIMLAATVSDSDEKKLAKLVHEKSPGTPVIKATKFDVIKAGGIGPDPAAIAKVFRKKLGKEGL